MKLDERRQLFARLVMNTRIMPSASTRNSRAEVLLFLGVFLAVIGNVIFDYAIEAEFYPIMPTQKTQVKPPKQWNVTLNTITKTKKPPESLISEAFPLLPQKYRRVALFKSYQYICLKIGKNI